MCFPEYLITYISPRQAYIGIKSINSLEHSSASSFVFSLHFFCTNYSSLKFKVILMSHEIPACLFLSTVPTSSSWIFFGIEELLTVLFLGLKMF